MNLEKKIETKDKELIKFRRKLFLLKFISESKQSVKQELGSQTVKAVISDSFFYSNSYFHSDKCLFFCNLASYCLPN